MVRALGVMVITGMLLGASSANAQSLGEAAAATGIHQTLRRWATRRAHRRGKPRSARPRPSRPARRRRGGRPIGWGGKGGGHAGWTAPGAGWKGSASGELDVGSTGWAGGGRAQRRRMPSGGW
jgi:hypothetical protein